MSTKVCLYCVTLVMSLALPVCPFASSLQEGEKRVLNEIKDAIPKDKIKTVDDLHAKWKEVQTGKSNAVIIDIRTKVEFDAGHIQDSNNIDSGHAYSLPRKIDDPNAEIWVFCRTKHRASYFVGMLYKYGYKNVYLAENGIKEWAEKGYPLVNKYMGKIEVKEYEKELEEDFQFREDN